MTIQQTIIIIIAGLVMLFWFTFLFWAGLSLIKESISFLYLGLESKNWQKTKGEIIVSQSAEKHE